MPQGSWEPKRQPQPAEGQTSGMATLLPPSCSQSLGCLENKGSFIQVPTTFSATQLRADHVAHNQASTHATSS